VTTTTAPLLLDRFLPRYDAVEYHEIRVDAPVATARRRFLRYWRLIGPFSALIRILLLRSIARAVDRT